MMRVPAIHLRDGNPIEVEIQKSALRSGVESSLSQGTWRFELRRSRYIGLARTYLQQLLKSTAMPVAQVMAW